ncbi:MAG: alcohol dehydrogenase catalytic domain-containing protein [Sphaerochaetaceae bacterium]
MKALYYIADKVMELRNIEIPKPKKGQYLVRVKACGICGSDFEGYLGKTGRRIAPMIMGHEFSGTIEEVPTDITPRFHKGERVVVFPKPFCGTCEYCKKGLVNVCPSGICMGVMDADGAMCEYVAIDEKYLIPFSEQLDFVTASLTEPLAVAYRATHKISDPELKESKYILVVGAGTIGLLVVAMLKFRGAKNVIVSDATDYRLDVAKTMKADYLINPMKEDAMSRIKEITNGRMCDFSIEAVGIAPTAASSLDALRIGGTAIWIGNAQKMVQVNMQKIVTTELTIKGNYVYDFDGFVTCVSLLERGDIDVKPLVTNIYPLADSVQAFKALENNKEGKMLKVVLEMK